MAGGRLAPPLLQRGKTQKVLKCQKFEKIRYPSSRILAFLLSSGALSKNALFTCKVRTKKSFNYFSAGWGRGAKM